HGCTGKTLSFLAPRLVLDARLISQPSPRFLGFTAMPSGSRYSKVRTVSGETRAQSGSLASRCFLLVLIKPSHYDDEGYVIRWWRAMIPSNSLAAMYAIADDCAKRHVLGPDVDIAIEAIDETNTRVDVTALLARFREHNNFGLVALVGVQSNQYPRALDIARPFKAAGIPAV